MSGELFYVQLRQSHSQLLEALRRIVAAYDDEDFRAEPEEIMQARGALANAKDLTK